MRLTTFILIIALTQLSAKSFSQISLNEKNTLITDVLKVIEKQSGFVFLYDYKDLKDARVSVNIKNASVAEALDASLMAVPLVYTLSDTRTITIKPKVLSFLERLAERLANIDVRGTVVDEQNRPLAGATVKIKGTKRSIITNANGGFELKDIAEDAILIITFVGKQTEEISLKGKSQITVNMKTESSSLKETVVTAFGIEKSAKEIGYSAATVKGDDLIKANSGNLITGLTGRVSGLNISTQSPDMTPQMQVLLRGVRSFSRSSNNQPLFVLNGSPLSFGSDQNSASLILEFINNINPVDVDKVTILKGANATALYGPEGVNGVIIITTKKGQKGKPSINFRNTLGFQRLDYRANKYEQFEYGSGTGSVDADKKGIYSGTQDNGWGPKYDGSMRKLGRPDEEGNYQEVPYQSVKDKRRFYNSARTNQTNLSISQGDDISNLYMGLGYTDQRGILPGDKRTSFTGFISGGRKYGGLDVNFNVNYARENADLGPEDFGPNGPSFIPFLKYKDYENYHWADNNHYYSDADVMSPYQAIDNNRRTNTGNSATFNLTLGTKILPWLTIKENPSVTLFNKYAKEFSKPVNFSDWAKKNGGVTRTFDRLATLKESNTTVSTLNNNLTLTAINQAGDFAFRNMIGNIIDESRTKFVAGTSNSLGIPIYNLAYGTDNPRPTERYIVARRFSLFATSTIGYKQKVFMELTARNDWDSKRAEAGRGKDLYVGANVSVLLRDLMPSLQQLSWLSYLQLRGAVTTTANMNIEPFQSQQMLDRSPQFPFTNPNGNVVSFTYKPENPNPNLKPEKIFSIETGFASRLFQDAISLDFAYYWQRNNGVITNSDNSWMSGAPSIDNLGIMNNWGYEIDLKLNSLAKNTNGFNFTAGLRLAYNTNEVKWLPNDYRGVYVLSRPGESKNGNMGVVARQGHSAFEYWLYDYQRDPQGRVVVDQFGYPIIKNTEAVYAGSTTPKYVGGLTLNFSYKQFSLSALAECSLGGQHYFSPLERFMSNGLHKNTTYNDRNPYIFPNSVYIDANGDYVENKSRYTDAANSALYGRMSKASLLNLTSANYLKLRELTFYYETPLKGKTVKKFNAGIYGRNLFYLYSKDNIYGDPQLIKGPGRQTAGVQASSGSNTGTAAGNAANSTGNTPSGLVEYGLVLSIQF